MPLPGEPTYPSNVTYAFGGELLTPHPSLPLPFSISTMRYPSTAETRTVTSTTAIYVEADEASRIRDAMFRLAGVLTAAFLPPPDVLLESASRALIESSDQLDLEG